MNDDLKTELEQVKAQLDAANRRENKLREAINQRYPAIMASNANAISFNIEEGEPFAGIGNEALAKWIKSVGSYCTGLHAALQPDAGTLSADCRATQKAALSQMSPGAGSADISQQANQPDAGGHNHTCSCGHGKGVNHPLGKDGCCRALVPAPRKLQNDFWEVDGVEGAVTGFTLREQWGYYRLPCGCWSRPTLDGPRNSVDHTEEDKAN